MVAAAITNIYLELWWFEGPKWGGLKFASLTTSLATLLPADHFFYVVGKYGDF